MSWACTGDRADPRPQAGMPHSPHLFPHSQPVPGTHLKPPAFKQHIGKNELRVCLSFP